MQENWNNMYISAIVKSNAKRDAVVKNGDEYLIYTKSLAKDNSANLSVINILSEYFNVSKKNIFIKSGLKSKKKLIEIENI